MLKALANKEAAAARPAPSTSTSPPRQALKLGQMETDLSSILGTPTSDETDLDTSPLGKASLPSPSLSLPLNPLLAYEPVCWLMAAGVAKRVSVVLLLGVALGVGLFYAGLQYLYPH